MKVLVICLLAVGLAAGTPLSLGSLLDMLKDEETSPALNATTRAAAQVSCNCGWTNRGRIIGGKETGRNEYPLVVNILTPSQFCGGTIITPWHVLTAAHCTEGEKPAGLRIYAGAHNFQKSNQLYRVARIIDHERYNPDSVENDISLLVTSAQIAFNQNVGPACLPANKLNLAGQTVKALGWGYERAGGKNSDVLREVDLQIISNDVCKKRWRGLKDTNVCSFDIRKDTCQGDSGGPLIWLDPAINRYTLTSLVSYGAVCGSGQPGVNTDVSAYIPWINKHVQASKPGTKTCTKV